MTYLADKKVKIDMPVGVLEGSIRSLNTVLGNMTNIANKLIGVGGLDPIALIALAGTLTVGIIRDMQKNQAEYEQFIRKERGLNTHQQYLAWQAQDRINTRASYRGDTN